MHYKRLLTAPNYSFFLFGSRGVGKSTWSKRKYKNDIQINLLDTNTFLELSSNPSHIKNIIGENKAGKIIFIDEIQRIPDLLNEVHNLIQEKNFQFVLTGSSTIKLKEAGVNLLAGRAIVKHLGPFCYEELKDVYDFDFHLKFGNLPLVVNNKELAYDILDTYVGGYIDQEIRSDIKLRKIEPFIRFLKVASLLNGQILNYKNIATLSKVPQSSVKNYFSVLEDTLIGSFLPAYKAKAKVREYNKPKFYFFDTGVVRACANLLNTEISSEFKGSMLETLVLHELKMYNNYFNKRKGIYYYAYPDGEIDFIIEIEKQNGDKKAKIICIEVKTNKTWRRANEKTINNLISTEKVDVIKSFGIYLGEETLYFNNIEVSNAKNFFNDLYLGKIF